MSDENKQSSDKVQGKSQDKGRSDNKKSTLSLGKKLSLGNKSGGDSAKGKVFVPSRRKEVAVDFKSRREKNNAPEGEYDYLFKGQNLTESEKKRRIEIIKNANNREERVAMPSFTPRVVRNDHVSVEVVKPQKEVVEDIKDKAVNSTSNETVAKVNVDARKKKSSDSYERSETRSNERSDTSSGGNNNNSSNGDSNKKFVKRPQLSTGVRPSVGLVDVADLQAKTSKLEHTKSKDEVKKKEVLVSKEEVSKKAKKIGESDRRGSKIHVYVNDWETYESTARRTRSLASIKRAKEKEKKKQMGMQKAAQKVYREVTIPDAISVQDLANRMTEKSADIIKSLMKLGIMATINQMIDADTAELVVMEFGHTPKRVSEFDVENLVLSEKDSQEQLEFRPPVVTVMGHVDHGKTSLLDALRNTDVVGGEAGGITQHIGAYQVTLKDGRKITFIDTPGHSAFTEMRARGAKVTDIVVLVVAADDGIMPQTIEAIRHAQSAGVPIVVAINKMDKPGADSDKVKNELLNYDIVVEDFGGDVLSVPVSAKTGMNLDKLEEIILLQAEVLDLKANPNRKGEGVVIEAKMEKGRGAVATVLLQKGTLRVGDAFVAGAEWGKVRALVNERGRYLDDVLPSQPSEIIGFDGVPSAGDTFVVVENESKARELAEFRSRQQRLAKTAISKTTTANMFERIKEGEIKELKVIIKADVHGSIEAIAGSLEKLGTDEVKVTVVYTGVGPINESDVSLAYASGAMLIGFNIRASVGARDLARRDNVEIRYYSIIYNIIDDIRALLSGLMSPEEREKINGYAQIREIFHVSKLGNIAGCMVTEGIIKRNAKIRILRDNVVIHEGNLSSLKRFKDDAKEVRENYECGMTFESYQDIKIGDVVESFEIEKVDRVLS